jgi:hypothetical protein
MKEPFEKMCCVFLSHFLYSKGKSGPDSLTNSASLFIWDARGDWIGLDRQVLV